MDIVIGEYLPHRYFSTAKKSLWMLDNEELHAAARAAEQCINSPQNILSSNLYKQGARRLLFKTESNNRTYFVKSFPLQKIRHRLKYKKYAPAEVVNLLIANRKNIPVPKVFGYGQQRQFGLIKWTAALIDYIDRETMEEKMVGLDSFDDKLELIRQSYHLFDCMFKAACFHMDFKPDAILMANDDNTQNVAIDFQYVHYMPRPIPEILAVQAGYFAWYTSTWKNLLPVGSLNDWFDDLLIHLSISKTRRIRQYFENAQRNRLRYQHQLFLLEELLGGKISRLNPYVS